MNIVTLCLSCGRFDLLQRALESYRQCMPVENELIVYDDSMRNLGQAKALDHLIELGLATNADFFMMLEDDWIFQYGVGWYYDSIWILQNHPEIMIIGLSLTSEIRSHMLPGTELSVTRNDFIKIVPHEPWQLSERHAYWNGWIGSPKLMRRQDVYDLPKFSNYIAEERFDQQAWKPMFYDKGRKSIWLDKQYCVHIGDNRSLFPTGDMLNPEMRTWLK